MSVNLTSLATAPPLNKPSAVALALSGEAAGVETSTAHSTDAVFATKA